MVVGIMLAIGYSQRFALGIGAFFVVVSTLAMCQTAALRSEALAVLLTAGLGMGVAVLMLHDIRTRSRLLEVCIGAAAATFLMTWVVGLWQGTESSQILKNSLWSAGGATSVGFLMQGLLPLVEKLFSAVTGMTLVDYGAATKPPSPAVPIKSYTLRDALRK